MAWNSIGIFAAIFLTLGGAAVTVFFLLERRRRDGMAKFAVKCGMSFSAKTPPAALVDQIDLPLFCRGSDTDERNFIDSTADGTSVVVFDYMFTILSGRSKLIRRQTVCWLDSAGLQLPAFTLQPKNLFHRICRLFGYRTIDLRDYPDFGLRFVLRGADEAAIRELFDDGRVVMTFLQMGANYNVEADESQMIVYRSSKRIRVKELNSFLEDAYRIFAVFQRES